MQMGVAQEQENGRNGGLRRAAERDGPMTRASSERTAPQRRGVRAKDGCATGPGGGR